MSFNTDKSLLDFFRFNDHEKKQLNDQRLVDLLEENHLAQKKIPEGPNSLLRAISDALYFTTQYYDKIQQSLIKHLRRLVSSNSLPTRLQMFQDNNNLLKDYCNNPHLSGFQKVNLELVASFFKVKVIIYAMSDDYYLTSTIINNNYSKPIELLRTTTNYFDTVYSKDFMERAGVCQNTLLNLINHVSEGYVEYNFKDMNKDIFINHEYENWASSKVTSPNTDHFRITKGRHKKSYSDSFHLLAEDQQMKFYDIFKNIKPPEDFFKLIQQRKDTMESNHSINANFDFVDEIWNESSKQSAADTQKNSNNSLIIRQEQHLKPFKPPLTQPSQEGEEEIEKAFLSDKGNDIFLTRSPPGLSPNKPQTSENFTEELFAQENRQKSMKFHYTQSPLKSKSPGYFYPVISNKYTANFSLNKLDIQRTKSAKTLTLSIKSNEFTMSPEQITRHDKTDQPDSAELKEKKKPIILDESTERHTGRLKFFDESKNYGFIVMDEDGSDIFVHLDDLMRANIPRFYLKTAKLGNPVRLSFSCMKYIGKYNESRKATDIQIIDL